MFESISQVFAILVWSASKHAVSNPQDAGTSIGVPRKVKRTGIARRQWADSGIVNRVTPQSFSMLP